MNAQKALEQLGYPAHQAKIYLACLKMGDTKVAQISEQVAMPRTTVIELLEHMHRRGLMNYYLKRGRKVWTAEHPEKLLKLQQEHEATLKAIMPNLLALAGGGGAKPAVRYFEGVEEIKNIFEDIIETKHHMKALVSWDDFKEVFGREFVYDFIERRYTHFLKIQFITPKTASAQKLRLRDAQELRQTRFLPEHVELRRVSNFIYGDKVAMVSMNRKVPVGLIVEDPDVVHAMDIYFESLWHYSKED